MTVASLSYLSLQNVRVTIGAEAAGVPINPSSDTVQLAFTAPGVEPVSGDWHAASWQTNSTTTPPTYSAKVLVGPTTSIALAPGTWDVWTKIFDSPEQIVMRAGELRVY